MSDNPWENLSTGEIDARRVDANGKYDFFWSLVEENPSLLLRFTGFMTDFHPLPKIRNLEIFYQSVEGGRALVVSLRDHDQMDLFETFCRDVIKEGENCKKEHDVIRKVILRTLRWYHFLRGGDPSGLTEPEQMGLIGELDFLKILIEIHGPDSAVASWKGPEGFAKDFMLPDLCVEMKTRKSSSKFQVKISSGQQLEQFLDLCLVLRVSDVDMSSDPNDLTLSGHVHAVDRLLEGSSAVARWEQLLAATGFDQEHNYSGIRWKVGERRNYLVKDDFPRLTPPFPGGVSNVKYVLDIGMCSRFRLSDRDFQDCLKVGADSKK